MTVKKAYINGRNERDELKIKYTCAHFEQIALTLINFRFRLGRINQKQSRTIRLGAPVYITTLGSLS